MNISKFKKLDEGKKERIGDNVSRRIVTRWDKSRPADLEELSQSIDLDSITIDTREDIFGIKQSLPTKCSHHTLELYQEFCDDIITEIVTGF